MQPMQKKVVEEFLPQLCDILKSHERAVLYFREKNYITDDLYKQLSEISLSLQPTNLLDKLKHSDNGWTALLNFLGDHGNNKLKKQLETSFLAYVQPANSPTDAQKFVDHLRRKLAAYYQDTYSFVIEHGNRDSCRVQETFIGMKWLHNGQTTKEKNDEDIPGYEHVLQRLQQKQKQHYPLIVVEGKPGYGKTTICKMIAVEWASCCPENTEKKAIGHYDLVLICPLRDTIQRKERKCNDQGSEQTAFQSLASVFASWLQKSEIECDENMLSKIFAQKKHKVLLILDGLDEYEQGSCRQLDDILQPDDPDTPSTLPAHIIITTRPQAMKKIHNCKSYYSLQGLTDDLMLNFALKQFQILESGASSETAETAKTFTAELKKSKIQEAARAPLLLKFCCHTFAELKVLPNSLFDIYDKMFQHMLYHSQKRGRINTTGGWRDLRKISDVCLIALRCLTRKMGGKLSFPTRYFDDEEIDRGMFLETGLLHVDYACKEPNLSFPVKSFQEFCAAYCICETLDKLRLKVHGMKPGIKDKYNTDKVYLTFDNLSNAFEWMAHRGKQSAAVAKFFNLLLTCPSFFVEQTDVLRILLSANTYNSTQEIVLLTLCECLMLPLEPSGVLPQHHHSDFKPDWHTSYFADSFLVTTFWNAVLEFLWTAVQSATQNATHSLDQLVKNILRHLLKYFVLSTYAMTVPNNDKIKYILQATQNTDDTMCCTTGNSWAFLVRDRDRSRDRCVVYLQESELVMQDFANLRDFLPNYDRWNPNPNKVNFYFIFDAYVGSRSFFEYAIRLLEMHSFRNATSHSSSNQIHSVCCVKLMLTVLPSGEQQEKLSNGFTNFNEMLIRQKIYDTIELFTIEIELNGEITNTTLASNIIELFNNRRSAQLHEDNLIIRGNVVDGRIPAACSRAIAESIVRTCFLHDLTCSTDVMQIMKHWSRRSPRMLSLCQLHMSEDALMELVNALPYMRELDDFKIDNSLVCSSMAIKILKALITLPRIFTVHFCKISGLSNQRELEKLCQLIMDSKTIGSVALNYCGLNDANIPNIMPLIQKERLDRQFVDNYFSNKKKLEMLKKKGQTGMLFF